MVRNARPSLSAFFGLGATLVVVVANRYHGSLLAVLVVEIEGSLVPVVAEMRYRDG